MTGKDLELHVSTDGGEWTDISGSSCSWEPTGGELETGAEWTAGSRKPVIGVGPAAPGGGTFRIVYTEETGEAADLLNGYYEARTLLYARARPRGSAVNYWQWTDKGYFTSNTFPSIQASSGDILVAEVGWHGAGWDQSAQVS